MYSRNLFNLLKPALVKGELAIDWNDEVFAGCGAHARWPNQARSNAQSRGGRTDMIDGVIALYIFMLAAFTGYEVISRVPVILHTRSCRDRTSCTASSWSGAMVALAAADTTLVRVIGFIGVVLAAGNAVGGYVVTERMLKMFVLAGRRKDLEDALRFDCSNPDAALLSRGGGAVHPRPEAHEFAGDRRERRALGGLGMLLATVVTLAFMGASSLNLMLVIAAIAVGGIVAWSAASAWP